jgi:leader peptidase (prepilin peptidase)/N-methyltransferase
VPETLIYFALSSSLLALSVIDENTFEIPMCFNWFIIILGVVNLVLNHNDVVLYLAGAFSVSLFLLLVYLITHGNGLGFGDVKLMFSCGLLVGWKNIVIGFLIGCIIAIIVHSIRMKVSKKEHKLAFGPYLSLGVYVSLFIGTDIMNMYLKLIGVM